MSSLHNRVRWAVAVNCVLLIAGIALDPAIARANDSPCPPVAEAIEANKLREFLQTHSAVTMSYDLLENEALWQRLRNVTDPDEYEAILVEAMRQELAAISPTLPEIMAEPISHIGVNVGVELSRVDIDNDGESELWFEAVGGSWRCENHWFYRALPPHELIAFFGTAPRGEAKCSYSLDVVRINDANYLMMSEDANFFDAARISMLTWQAPMQLHNNCSVRWKASGQFKTETACAPTDQAICDRIAELAPTLTENEPAYLAAGRVTDLAAIHVDGQLDGSLSGFGFGEYADVDNDGDQDIFAGTYDENYYGREKVTYFGFSLIRWIDGGYRASSALTMEAWFGAGPNLPTRIAYPVIIGERTYIVLRDFWARDDPGGPGGYTFKILEIDDDESRLVGKVGALPILYVTNEWISDSPYFWPE